MWVSFFLDAMAFFVSLLWANTTTYIDYIRHFGSTCSLKSKKNQQKIKTKTAQKRHLHHTEQRGIQDALTGSTAHLISLAGADKTPALPALVSSDH